MSSADNDIIVYVPDLPINIPENGFEEMLRFRIEITVRVKMSDVKCYVNLGIAVIRLMNEDDKKNLVTTVQSIVFDTKLNSNISFVADINLDCYIVLDQKVSKGHSANEVAGRYMQVYKTLNRRTCQLVSTQFSNIFRIILNTFDELIQIAKAPDFKIANIFAVVY
ncbi:unnamed protein product [Rotaria magnacalcarata]|uniref:Uncharacterized protein n=1 Tax=Rotaria magnacalcarata TaxID=392030 RepID=A0A816PRW3_9BILA|nr:unnamed protein product [Rotaria magnacalcarata]